METKPTANYPKLQYLYNGLPAPQGNVVTQEDIDYLVDNQYTLHPFTGKTYLDLPLPNLKIVSARYDNNHDRVPAGDLFRKEWWVLTTDKDVEVVFYGCCGAALRSGFDYETVEIAMALERAEKRNK